MVCVDPGEMPLVDEGGQSKARHVRRVVEDPETQAILRDEVREDAPSGHVTVARPSFLAGGEKSSFIHDGHTRHSRRPLMPLSHSGVV